MIEVNKKSKLHFHWKVSPYDFSKEKENSLITKISKKYGVPREKIKIIPEFTMINSDGEDIKVSSDIIANIQNPEFQQKLFKEYIICNNIKDYNFDLIKKIDNELNGMINYEVYDKYKQYTIKWIRWSNFLSYGDNNFFDFTTLKGLVLLNGEPANQSGKTTFAIDLLHFLLFGKTSKAATLDKVFNKHLPSASEVVVEGCINIEGVDYVIKRTLRRPELSKRSSRSRTIQKVEYYKIVGDSMEELVDVADLTDENSAQTNKVIKEAIGQESDFDMIMCATSSNLDELIEKKETDRGKLLSRWIGLLPIEEKDILAREKFNSEIKPFLLSSRYNTEQLKSEINTIQKNLETISSELKKYDKENKRIDSELIEDEKKRENLVNLKFKIDESLLKVDIETLNASIKRLTDDGVKKNAEKEAIQKEIDAIGEVDFTEKDYDELQDSRNKISIEIGSLTEKYKSTMQMIDALKKSEFCPTCGRKYDNIDNTKAIDEKTKEVGELLTAGKAAREELNNLDKTLADVKTKRDKYNEKSRLVVKMSALDVQLANLRSEYKDLKNTLNEYHKNNEAIDHNNKIEIELRNLQAIINSKRSAKETNIHYIAKLTQDAVNGESEIKSREEVIKKINEEEIILRNWRIYLDMVGKNGITKMVLRKTLPIINANISFLLSDVCDFTVEITINDKNDIMFFIVKDGVYSDLTSGSGFERTAAALALRIVLGNISTLPRCSFIVLDEILGRVAEENLENIRTLLDKISDKYQFIMQISHLESIKDWHNEIISIKKDGNISKICVSSK